MIIFLESTDNLADEKIHWEAATSTPYLTFNILYLHFTVLPTTALEEIHSSSVDLFMVYQTVYTSNYGHQLIISKQW